MMDNENPGLVPLARECVHHITLARIFHSWVSKLRYVSQAEVDPWNQRTGGPSGQLLCWLVRAGRLPGISIARNFRVDDLAPNVDAAGHVLDRSKPCERSQRATNKLRIP